MNTLLARYTHGPGVDDPKIIERDLDASGTFDASERFAYHTDGLGSVTELTDVNGGITRAYVYDSFGRIVEESGTIENPFTYTGREFDAESGLYFYRARYYDAQTGRFLSEDPIWLEGGSNNFYPYVANNPLNFIDPSGLIPCTKCGDKCIVDFKRKEGVRLDMFLDKLQECNEEIMAKDIIDCSIMAHSINWGFKLLNRSNLRRCLEKCQQ